MSIFPIFIYDDVNVIAQMLMCLSKPDLKLILDWTKFELDCAYDTFSIGW